jgi:hypothetical protein
MPGLAPGIYFLYAGNASNYGATAAGNFSRFETLKLTIEIQ